MKKNHLLKIFSYLLNPLCPPSKTFHPFKLMPNFSNYCQIFEILAFYPILYLHSKFCPINSAKNVIGDQLQQRSKQDDGQLPVWVYVIFRKNPSSGHDKMSIKDRWGDNAGVKPRPPPLPRPRIFWRGHGDNAGSYPAHPRIFRRGHGDNAGVKPPSPSPLGHGDNAGVIPPPPSPAPHFSAWPHIKLFPSNII